MCIRDRVVRAISRAEEALQEQGEVFSLGDIVHNRVEVQRLERLGMHTVTHDQMPGLKGRSLFIRAHGEPPSTYRLAEELGIELIDFKLEFGKTADGTLVLADEISPDTCRFWDSNTGEKLDKDRFLLPVFCKASHRYEIGWEKLVVLLQGTVRKELLVG